MTETFYTNELRTFVRTRNWPEHAKLDIVEFMDEGCLKIKLYRDNINSLDGEEKLQLATVLNETLWHIRNQGVPVFTWVAEGDGNVREL